MPSLKISTFPAGVIDRDYRGNVGVVMFNHSQSTFKVNKGDRVAQLICELIIYPDIVEAEVINPSDYLFMLTDGFLNFRH